MKKRVYVLLVALLLTLVLAVPASAGRWILAEGTVSSGFDFEDRTAIDVGDKCLIKIKPYQLDFEGTVTGTGIEKLTVLSQGACEDIYPGKYDDRFWFEGTFEGEVDGRTGTCQYVGHGQTWAGTPPTQDVQMTLLGCKGELRGMRGVLYMDWDELYWGRIRFVQAH